MRPPRGNTAAWDLVGWESDGLGTQAGSSPPSGQASGWHQVFGLTDKTKTEGHTRVQDNLTSSREQQLRSSHVLGRWPNVHLERLLPTFYFCKG